MAHVLLRDLLQATEDSLSSGHVEAALANCESILASFPESLETLRLLGEIYLAQGRLDEALSSFDWVLTNDPENVVAYCNRAMVSERMHDVDTSLDCYQQAYELSRGNSQIRQEFNQLSTRVGQQGFMFSRAGLARLYMRGNLLTQAVQEWEIVLAATPDRLDARTGLLETLWRDGLFDRVEQMAAQILQSVPGCLKALLLLAYVTAPKDMLQARELLHRAEALDPDLLMAQDLFADALVSHPDDPFLKQLQKSPATLLSATSVASSDISQFSTTVTPAAAFSLAGEPVPASVSPELFAWSAGDAAWSSDTTLIKPRPAAETDFAALSPWGADASTSLSGVTQEAAPVSLSLDALAAQPADPQLEPWQLLQDALHDVSPVQTDHQQWESLGDFSSPQSPASNPTWEGLEDFSSPLPPTGNPTWEGLDNGLAPESTTTVWAQEENAPAPPAWLNMLTQADRHQMSEALPVIVPQEPAPATSQPAPPQPAQITPVTPAAPVAPEKISVSVPSVQPPAPPLAPLSTEDELADLDEDSFFGPAWLKSIGAADLAGQAEPAEHALSMPPTPLAEAAPAPTVLPQPASAPAPIEARQTVAPEPQDSRYEQWQVLEPQVVKEQPAPYEPWQSASAQSEAAPVFAESRPPLEAEPQKPTPISASQPAVAPQPEEGHSVAYQQWKTLESELQEQLAAFESWKPAESPTKSSSDEYAPWQPAEPEPVQLPQTIASVPELNEQQLVATMEEFESQLRSQGFVPLEPRSLSSIAQTQEPIPQAQSTPPPSEQAAAYQEPSLSSALAELGSMLQHSRTQPAPAPLSVEPTSTPAEPSWMQALRSVPATPTLAQQEAVAHSAGQNVAPAASAFNHAVSEPPVTPPVRVEPVPGPLLQPAPVAREQKAQPQPAKVPAVPAARANPFMESELETTMKRPAVRLQSLPQRSIPQREQPPAPAASRGRAAEPRNERPVSKPADNAQGHRERLLNGYQHQLVGDYDEAMQEYRVVIRSSPDLLAEVVSNVRALLKLAPSYSAGYRVLGDAYMRQGEYLQAMESYNKALTMAKKAR